MREEGAWSTGPGALRLLTSLEEQRQGGDCVSGGTLLVRGVVSRKEAGGPYYSATFILPLVPFSSGHTYIHRSAQMHRYKYSTQSSASYVFKLYTHIWHAGAPRYTPAHVNTVHSPEYNLLTCRTQHLHDCSMHVPAHARAHTHTCEGSMPSHACKQRQPRNAVGCPRVHRPACREAPWQP